MKRTKINKELKKKYGSVGEAIKKLLISRYILWMFNKRTLDSYSNIKIILRAADKTEGIKLLEKEWKELTK
jgi:hypothetical protein